MTRVTLREGDVVRVTHAASVWAGREGPVTEVNNTGCPTVEIDHRRMIFSDWAVELRRRPVREGDVVVLARVFSLQLRVLALRLKASWARCFAPLYPPREEWRMRYRAERLDRRANDIANRLQSEPPTERRQS